MKPPKTKTARVDRDASILLTPKQKDFADARLVGASLAGALAQAGYSENMEDPEKRSEEVRKYLAEARKGIVDATTLTRLDVIQGILDAITDAKLMAEPATMISGYKELAKIMGFNAPEVKKLDITVNGARVRSKMEALSDAELLQLSEGHTLEGEYHSVQ